MPRRTAARPARTTSTPPDVSIFTAAEAATLTAALIAFSCSSSRLSSALAGTGTLASPRTAPTPVTASRAQNFRGFFSISRSCRGVRGVTRTASVLLRLRPLDEGDRLGDQLLAALDLQLDLHARDVA